MTNTADKSCFTWSRLDALVAGDVLAEWAEFGPLVAAPEPIGSIDGVPFAVVRFDDGSERKFPFDAEVRVS